MNIRDPAQNFVQSAPEQPTHSKGFAVKEQFIFSFIVELNAFRRSTGSTFWRHELKVKYY